MRNFVGIEGGISLVASALAIAASLLGCSSGSNVSSHGGAGGVSGGSGNTSGGATSTSTAGQGGTSSGGAVASVGSGGNGGTTASVGSGGTSGSGGSGTATSTVVTGGSGGSATVGTIDLCAGMVTDKNPHPMTTLAKPAVGGTIVDAEFGTTIRRITAVAGSGANAAIVPMYTTTSAWNADESLLILYGVGGGGHQLYNGKTYQPIRSLGINPADLEQVYWDTSDPDILYYVDGQEFIRYHVTAGTQDKLHSFSGLCGSSSVSNGGDPMFTSWDSHRLGLVCGNQMFIYDSSTDSVLGAKAVSGTPPAQVAPSGTLAYLEAGTGQVLDANLNLVRSLGLQVPDNHASLGRLANGHDTWNGAVYDDGNDDVLSNVGILVTWDMSNGTGGAVIGPKTGWPYPPDGHISAMAYKQPGWIFVSTIPSDAAGLQGKTLLGLENLIADTNTGVVCRVGRHRSWGKNNSVLGYWAEPHTVPSPSGTRAVFGSDWGNGASVDSYVLELPSYSP
jgi:hypothetical protein